MNPWKDIAPYKTSDAANFKGRDEDIKKFSRILQQNDFSVLYAESGIGKTSFINAGIIPAFADSEYYFVRIEFPLEVLASKTVSQDVLIANLEGWLCSKIFNEKIVESRLKSGLSTFTSFSDDAKLKNNLWWRLHAYEYIKDEKVVKPFIIFDQFEEIFQKASNEILKELFSILDSISGHIPPTNILKKLEEYEAQGIYIPLDNIIDFKVLFSMRKEYLAEFDYWTNDIFSNTQLLQSRMILLPFTRSQAEEVITGQVVEGKIVDSLTDIKDDILKLFEERAQTTTVHNRDKHVYEAFLLSVVCSRLHSIATNKQTAKLVKENIANIKLKELILNFYNESVGDIVPQRHLKIIENELVDNSGERNRVKPTTDNLLAIKFKERYLPKLKDRHIVKSADGYVELIHDRLAEAVFHKRNERKNKILSFKRLAYNGFFYGTTLFIDLFIFAYLCTFQVINLIHITIIALLIISTCIVNLGHAHKDIKMEVGILPQISSAFFLYLSLSRTNLVAFRSLSPGILGVLFDIFFALNILLFAINIIQITVHRKDLSNNHSWKELLGIKMKTHDKTMTVYLSIVLGTIICFTILFCIPKTSIELLRERAEHKEPDALYEMGNYYMQYYPNYEKAKKFFEEAAELGCWKAQTRINEIQREYANRNSFKEELKMTAVKALIYDAERHGYILKHSVIDSIYRGVISGRNVSIITNYIKKYEKNSLMEWKCLLAQHSDDDYIGYVGFEFWRGELVEKDYIRAFELYMEGKSHHNIILCYLNGWGVERSAEKAMNYAIENGIDIPYLLSTKIMLHLLLYQK